MDFVDSNSHEIVMNITVGILSAINSGEMKNYFFCTEIILINMNWQRIERKK